MKNTIILLLFSCAAWGQTQQITGIRCFDKEIKKVRKADTLTFIEVDYFVCNPFKFFKNGKLGICNSMKTAKEINHRAMECVWNKKGTWSFKADILNIQTDSFKLMLQIIPTIKDKLRFLVKEVQVK